MTHATGHLTWFWAFGALQLAVSAPDPFTRDVWASGAPWTGGIQGLPASKQADSTRMVQRVHTTIFKT
jgi:hypothetical protein